jgi:hypothetical protein
MNTPKPRKMIKANELRIGNWLITEKGIPQKVEYIGETIGFTNECGGTDKHQKNPIFSYDIDKIKPIPLTPEILEKCGFEHSNFISREFDKEGIYNFKAVDHWEDGFLIICNFMQAGVMCKYLHQLQNLYFALAGEELLTGLSQFANRK